MRDINSVRDTSSTCSFGDEWMDAASSHDFWRLWNRPVHEFIKCHVFYALLHKGLSKSVASLCACLFSAVLHEFVLSLSLGVFSGVFFLAMVIQSPVIYAERRYRVRNQRGIFRLYFFIIGQPLMIILIRRQILA